jgi:sarcosine oxidase, subunit beta
VAEAALAWSIIGAAFQLRTGMSQMPQHQDVVIIGGGITGCAAAYEIARTGLRVCVLEQRELASMASGRTLAGVRQSGRHPAELPLAIAAVERWSVLDQELGADLEYRQRGNLRLAEDENDVKLIEKMVIGQWKQGLEIEFLDSNSAVREVAPALSHHILAASYTPTDGHANPVATVHAYADAARRYGAAIHENVAVHQLDVNADRVTGVKTSQGTFSADAVVVAAGVESPPILASTGVHLAINLALVPVIQTVPIGPLFEQVLGTAKAYFAARQEVNGKVRFSSGGRPIDVSPSAVTWETMQPSCSRTAETMTRAFSIVPALEKVPVNTIWGGLVDMTADGIPVIDRVEQLEGLIVAAGYCEHGFCLGPVSGEIIRDLVLDQQSKWPIEPFRWDRFLASSGPSKPELLG